MKNYNYITQLISLISPLEYTHTVTVNYRDAKFEFFKYVRGDYACVVVFVVAYSRSSFLLRTDGERLWHGDFDVIMKTVEKEIDGITYTARVEVPTEWHEITEINPNTKRDLISIIQKLIELESDK